MVPIDAAISRTSMEASPCSPTITTSSPGATSVPVTSIIVMSMHTEPTIGTRRPRTSMKARAGEAAVETVGVAGGHDRDRARLVAVVFDAVARRLRRANALHRDDAAVAATAPAAAPIVVASGGGTTP